MVALVCAVHDLLTIPGASAGMILFTRFNDRLVAFSESLQAPMLIAALAGCLYMRMQDECAQCGIAESAMLIGLC